MNTRTVAYSTSIVSSCPVLGRKMATKPMAGAFYLHRAERNGFMPRGCGLHTIDTTILRNISKSTKKILNAGKLLGLPDSRFGCVASEGGAPFVARRAVKLHGCALPHCAPPPPATPPDPPCVTRDTGHGGVFYAGGKAGGSHFKVQAPAAVSGKLLVQTGGVGKECPAPVTHP